MEDYRKWLNKMSVREQENWKKYQDDGSDCYLKDFERAKKAS